MQPAVLLPREHQAIAGGPIQLAVGGYGLKDAAVALVTFPNLFGGTRLHVGHAYRERFVGLAPRREHFWPRRRELADPRDMRSIRRPRDVAVAIERRIDVAK